MSRTKQIILGNEFSEKRSFAKNPANLAALQSAGVAKFSEIMDFTSTPEDIVTLVAEFRTASQAAIAVDLAKPSSNYRYSSRPASPSATDRSELFIKVLVDFLAKRYSYSSKFSEQLLSVLRQATWGWKKDSSGETTLVSAAMLNEFLNTTDETRTYGDFLEENWDTIYARYEKGDFSQYAWTAEVLGEVEGQGLLSFRPRLPKKSRQLLEDLSLAEIKMIRLNKKSLRWVTNASFPTRIKSVLGVANGDKSVGTPPVSVTNRFYSALAKVQGRVSDGVSYSLVDVNRVFVTEVMKEIRLTSDKSSVSSDLLFTDKAKRYADFLFENADNFNLHEMFFAIVPVIHTKWIARSGTREEILDFFLSVLDKYDTDSAMDIFRMVGEAGATYDLELPTILQWRKALDLGTLDVILDASITMALVSVSEKVVPKNTKQTPLRAVFGKRS